VVAVAQRATRGDSPFHDGLWPQCGPAVAPWPTLVFLGHEEHALMPDHDDIPRRRRVLVLDVTQAASEVSRLVHEARDLNLPVEPGVRDGRDALVRWAVLLEDVIP
jgi:hypothetical protein